MEISRTCSKFLRCNSIQLFVVIIRIENNYSACVASLKYYIRIIYQACLFSGYRDMVELRKKNCTVFDVKYLPQESFGCAPDNVKNVPLGAP